MYGDPFCTTTHHRTKKETIAITLIGQEPRTNQVLSLKLQSNFPKCRRMIFVKIMMLSSLEQVYVSLLLQKGL